ncbi:MAG: hypothetical protein KGL92_15110 [Gammaproteobacteria bacterium]|nr:hypothetical protein [Gammaproteobacteria bacterium]
MKQRLRSAAAIAQPVIMLNARTRGTFLRSSVASRPLAVLALGCCLAQSGLGATGAEPAPPKAAAPEFSDLFEIFASAEYLRELDARPLPSRDEDPGLRADLAYGHGAGSWRFNADYHWTTEHQHFLERLQFGDELRPGTMLWVGRFQQPSSAWNDEHHRVQYLQTSISQPYIERWEEDEGILPQHITGVLLETRRSFGAGRGLELAAGAGAGPSIASGRLAPLEIIDDRGGAHRLAAAARITLRPDASGGRGASLLLGHDEIDIGDPAAVMALGAREADLDLLGAQITWHRRDWQLDAAGYRVAVYLHGLAGSRTERFSAGYLQLERALTPRVTAYGRAETSARTQESRYVGFLGDDEDWAYRRVLGGLRWDFASRQALSAEFARASLQAGIFAQFRLQWSAAFP